MNKKLSFLIVILIFSSISFSQWEVVNDTKNYSAQFTFDAVDSVIVLNVFKEETFLRVSKNFGKTWFEFASPSFTSLTINKSYEIWGCTSKGEIYHSPDFGGSWIKQYNDPKGTFLNYIKFFDDYNGVCVGDSPDSTSAVLVLNSSDGGKTWKSVNDSMGIGDVSYGTYYPISFPSKDVGYFDIAKADQLNKTEDGGKTWIDTNFPDPAVRIMDFYDENIGYVISSDYVNSGYVHIHKTEDGGISWEKKSTLNFSWPMSFEIVPENHEQIWFTDFDYLYYSGDNGKTVNKTDLGTHPKNEPTFVKFVSDKIGYVITDSAHVYITKNNGGYSTTGIKEKGTIPKYFTLHQNYPNPFNPTTNIEFDLSQESSVNLSVYDLLGNKVEDVFKGILDAGIYVFQFNGQNLSSAIYLFKLKVGENTQTKKMMLLK